MVTPEKRDKISLASIYFTFFIDNLGWSIVFPIFAPYFLDHQNKIFSPDLSDKTRTLVLGFFLMAFSLGQFLGAPILGEYADRHGRKKALVLSVFFTLVGMGLSAWSMEVGSLFFLFLGRLITGIFSANMSICLASITDLSLPENKAKNFGYLSLAAGLSFVLGAFIGGKLSDSSISRYFTFDFPLWISTWLTLFNLFFVLFGFKETSYPHPDVKFDLLESFKNIKMALKTEKIKQIYAIYFLFIFTWTILFQFTPVLAVERFYFTGSNIGDLALYMGLCWAIGSGYLNKILLRYFHPNKILEGCLISFTILCGLVVLPKHIYGILGILGLCVIIGGIAWPLCNHLISNLAPREIQGKVLGMSQSVQSFAMAIAPVIGGIAFHAFNSLPFFIGAAFSLVAVLIYFTLKDR